MVRSGVSHQLYFSIFTRRLHFVDSAVEAAEIRVVDISVEVAEIRMMDFAIDVGIFEVLCLLSSQPNSRGYDRGISCLGLLSRSNYASVVACLRANRIMVSQATHSKVIIGASNPGCEQPGYLVVSCKQVTFLDSAVTAAEIRVVDSEIYEA